MSGVELPDVLTVLAGPRTEPGPLIAELRERDPVCWIPGLNAWVITRHEDVRLLCNHPLLTADASAHEDYRAPTTTDPKAARLLAALPFRATPADPESLGRRLVHRTLSPRAIERTRQQIQEAVEEFAAPLRRRDDVVDLVGEFTKPISTTVIGRLLGVPDEGEIGVRFRNLPRAARNVRPFLSAAKREKAERAGIEVFEFVLELVEAHREALREGIITDLLAAGEANERTTKEDIVSVVAALVATGTNTPGNGASRGLLSLLKNPDQLDLLRGDRSLLPNAIEELLRYDSGLVAMARYVLEDFELRDRTLKKGQLVILSLTGANRDPRAFPDPERIDILRDTRATLAFGHGPHYCVGVHIARSELHLMLDAALDFLPPHARLLEDQIEWSSKGLMSQLKRLPVDFHG
ncbi:MAG: cytochrome P450 [Candidatus Binatia bacterium]